MLDLSHPVGQNSRRGHFYRRSRAPRTQGGLATESHQVPSPEVHGRSALGDAHGCRKGFDALPAGAFGVSSFHDDAHQQDDQN